MGTGVYLVAGLVVRDYAGPAAVFSFALAAFASLLSGVCYAEFGVRVPHCSGSAYQYSYACVGELVAFLVGWNLLLEYMIGSAAGACAISAAIDAMFGGAISDFGHNSLQLLTGSQTTGHAPAADATSGRLAVPPPSSHRYTKQWQFVHQKLLTHSSENGDSSTLHRLEALFDSGTYRPDFMAALVCCLMTALLASGVRKSVKFNNCLNALNLGLFAFIVLAALPYIDFRFWSTDFYANGRWDALQAASNPSASALPVPGAPPYSTSILVGHSNRRTIRQAENISIESPPFEALTESVERMSTTTSAPDPSTEDTSAITTIGSATTTISTRPSDSDEPEIRSTTESLSRKDRNESAITTTAATTEKDESKNRDEKKTKGVERKLTQSRTETTKIESGFAPFGWQGVLRGAATCFYGFVGFDVIACTGGQSEQPGKCVPLAMVGGTAAALAVYVLSCCLITLLVPTPLVSASSALVHMFDLHQADFAKSIAALGALSSLAVAMFGSMFPLPRVAAAMAADRLVWPRLAERSELTSGPMFGTIVLGAATSVLALICPLPLLVEMMSIGTLVAYTMVSLCVLLLRYRPIGPETNKIADNGSGPSGLAINVASGRTADAGYAGVARQCSRSSRLGSLDHSDGGSGRQWSIDGVGGRQTSRDDDDEDDDEEYGVNESLGHNQPVGPYGSVPYQYGGGSGGKRSPLMDFLEKCSACLFPYGWRVLGPPTEETSWHVLKLTAGYVASCICLDLLLAYTELSADRHFLLTLMIALAATAICTLFTIARQPQNKYDFF